MFAGLILLDSCEKEVFLDFDHQTALCLNCILNPAKTIEANLTLSRSINETGEFMPVNDATIELYENDSLMGQFTQGNNGIYTFKQKPVSGKHYKISVKAESFNTLTAESTVPYIPSIKHEKTNYVDYGNSLTRYDLKVELNDQPGANYYWLYSTSSVNDRKYGGGNYPMIAPFVDDFNKEYDNEAKFGFTYFMQIRLSDEGYDGQAMKFTIPDIPVMDNKKRMADYHFLSTDENYDKYIKTTIINRMKEQSDLPFYEPVQIYSNIENGTGIFGSCAVFSVKL